MGCFEECTFCCSPLLTKFLSWFVWGLRFDIQLSGCPRFSLSSNPAKTASRKTHQQVTFQLNIGSLEKLYLHFSLGFANSSAQFLGMSWRHKKQLAAVRCQYIDLHSSRVDFFLHVNECRVWTRLVRTISWVGKRGGIHQNFWFFAFECRCEPFGLLAVAAKVITVDWGDNKPSWWKSGLSSSFCTLLWLNWQNNLMKWSTVMDRQNLTFFFSYNWPSNHCH